LEHRVIPDQLVKLEARDHKDQPDKKVQSVNLDQQVSQVSQGHLVAPVL
jgi:hypothetical protein